MSAATIAAVRTEILDDPLLPQLLVRVTDSDGVEGVGECWWGVWSARDRQPTHGPLAAIASVVDDMLAPLSVGRSAVDIVGLWNDLRNWGYRYSEEGIFGCGLSGLDLALWDLAGHRLGCSAIELLGGACHSSLPAYASLPPLRSDDALRLQCERLVEAGFGAVKTHEIDPAHAVLVRDVVGPDVEIMVDVNGHYTMVEALEAAAVFRDVGVYWFEEPTWPMRDHSAMARVRSEGLPRLAAGENEWGVDGFRSLLSSGAIDFCQPELTKIGGLTAARQIGPLIEAANVALCPHSFRLGPSSLASLQWAMASPAGAWIEVPWLPEGAAFPSGVPIPEVDADGRVAAPTGHGLGLPVG